MAVPETENPQTSALETAACALAESHTLCGFPAIQLEIYSQLPTMADWLDKIKRYCARIGPEHIRVADWLLDNDYQILRAIRQVDEDLPASFYRRLPALQGPHDDRVPRIFSIAHAALNAMHKQLSFGNLVCYVNTYQEQAPLNLAELWALPSMLRLASLEHLSDAFQQLDPTLVPVCKISRYGADGRSSVPTDRISQAINNLGAVHAIEWTDFVDQTSHVERILSDDPAKFYTAMNFQTRDKYRQTVEILGVGSTRSETAIARRAIELAGREKPEDRRHHVGYWLIGQGREALEITLAYRASWPEQFHKLVLRHAGLFYALALATVFIAALALPVLYLTTSGAGLWAWTAGLLLSLLPASVLSMAVVHWLITSFINLRLLPALDYRKGIPSDCKTAVVVPVIISTAEEIPAMIERLELRRLSNPDPMLHFVLLSDLPDAAEKTLPEDHRIEAGLLEAIGRLNRQYGAGANGPFYLLHRPRHFNAAENCWMGWERKRGKLQQFNRFILGAELGEFSLCEGDVEQLRGTRFVITLDADTMLPPTAAAKLVGTMMHPLNRAEMDPESGRIVCGYSIVQPRLEVLPLSGPVSLFCRLFAGDTAIDIYSRAVSDLYQDLFGSGTFVGKGIYEVASFQRSLDNRVPDNAILSHDLFEGLHARTALASNIILYENFPATYPEYVSRLHRWIRGDWQLIPWLGKTVPTADGAFIQSSLSGLDRWKIIDNLRRSLVAPALLLLFLAGWTVLPGSAWLWTVLATAAPGIYLVGGSFHAIVRAHRRERFADVRHRIPESSGRWFLSITFLISDTLISVDAITRALWRVFVSRQNLLQWRSAAHVHSRLSHQRLRKSAWRLMWSSSVCAALLALELALYYRDALAPAAPFLVLWLVAPEISVWLGQPREPRRQHLNSGERAFLQRVARRTWHFFETFAGPDDNWLPPDNFQEDPKGEIAHRTSPTNIGLLLTSAMMAHDFGFIGTGDFAIRMRNALESLERLCTYRGHVLNWYDTRTLEPLEPQYVSTVDSGNLAVCLVALKQGCMDFSAGPVCTRELWTGLACTFSLLMEATRKLGGIDSQVNDRFESLFEQAFTEARSSAPQWLTIADKLVEHLWPEFEQAIAAAVAESDDSPRALLGEIHVWLERFHHDLNALHRRMHDYFPWLKLAENPPPGCEDIMDRVAEDFSPLARVDRISENVGPCTAFIEARLSSMGQESPSVIWLGRLIAALQEGASRQLSLRNDLLDLVQRADNIAFRMDFTLLYDAEVRLFRIGYNVSDGQPDHNHYDLLASEARLASFFAIAKRDVPMEHWFFLGRPVARLHGKPVVLSWSGSMFEYLMPPLFMPGHRDTLLGESESIAVEYQRRYASERGVPWGISESAFGVTDADSNYQYKAFGAAGLGLRRGLTEDLVIAPYASALALSCWPKAAVENLDYLERIGSLGIYGFIDALDFTRKRSPEGQAFRPVKTYMAHHQGMIVAAIANALDDDIFVRRVMSEKRMRAFEMLLQERIPWEASTEKGRIEEAQEAQRQTKRPAAELSPWAPAATATVPQMQMIGNGRMATWQSESGAGGLTWQGFALTRWLPDPSRDCHGYWLYLKDVESGAVWSAGRLPTGKSSNESTTIFHPHMVEHFRRNQDIAVRMETTVAPDDDIDIRRITVVNEGTVTRTIEFSSYAEVVLASPLDDERHPAFSKLFVGSEFHAAQNGLLFTRRPRRPQLPAPLLMHKAVFDGPAMELVGYETDRSGFVGRNGSLRNPQGLSRGPSQTTGWTLDPIMSLTVRAKLKPNETTSFALLSIAGSSRSVVWEIAERYTSASLDWVFRDAARMAAREVARLELDPAVLPDMQALASLLVQPHPALRAAPEHVEVNRYGQEDLWHFGISGDLPILLLRMENDTSSGLLETLIRIQHFWRRSALQVDIVVLRMGSAGYEDPLRETILAVLRDADAYGYLGRTGGIHLLFADHMDADTRRGVEAVAHVVLDDDGLPLSLKLDNVLERRALPPQLEASSGEPESPDFPEQRPDDLDFDNGIGGFDPESGDYIVYLENGEHTPAPWCNVLANDKFGTVVSESGLGFSWAINSGENRLTPCSNDPVADTPGEVLYLRDEVTASVWTVTPAPLGGSTACLIRHGAGFTQWQRQCHGLKQDLLVFVPPGDPVKLVRLRLTNQTSQARRITATYYAEWLLGALASRSKPHIVCEYDAALHAIVANNAWRSDFSDRIAFVSSTHAPHSVSGSRYDFLGHEGTLDKPAALRHMDLGGGFSRGGDTCAAYQIHLDLGAGESTEAVFMLGQGTNRAETDALISRYKNPDQVGTSFSELQVFWAGKLDAVQVKTPDPAFDLMVNRWLIYQTLASRMMARAGFYQASGAYGFRDQLQDSLALLHVDPERVRSHILRAAEHQFEDGDVQHWWHTPSGCGVKTHCSDDYIWLAYVTARYVDASADTAILDSLMPFLIAPPLRQDEQDRYARFDSGNPATLFEHCSRALEHMMRTGSHGLPLMGAGDWNDGMDRIGAQGHGESVWLAWFQISTIDCFAPLATQLGYPDRAARWQQHARRLKEAVDESAWDGEWFIRAFDDIGEPWGSSQNDECRIDSIAQSWAVLAGFGDQQRVKTAMASARQKLLHEHDRLVLLLDPPFHQSNRDPGYIQAYPPGIRENGGQYSHAGSWLGLAFAGLGDGDAAWRVFDILNPIRRITNRADALHYEREPYALAGDVSSQGANKGRGGWTWYTGAAGWTWQLGVEGIIGLRPVKGAFMIDPCLPKQWGGAEVRIRGRDGVISVKIEDPEHVGRGLRSLTVDGQLGSGNLLLFPGKGKESHVVVRLGRV